jgi:hypothetical protein
MQVRQGSEVGASFRFPTAEHTPLQRAEWYSDLGSRRRQHRQNSVDPDGMTGVR